MQLQIVQSFHSTRW